jgi:DNA-directed RNA polymerase subunit beta'
MREYTVPAAFSLLVKDGDLVVPGQPLTEGNLDPQQVLALVGGEGAQNYIISQVQEVYSSQGAPINDKHIEIIVRQMFSKVRITESGDSGVLVGETMDVARLREINDGVVAQGLAPAKYEQLLMGITKISLHTDSWLAAASFQETTRVLISAAVTGQTDYLRGLKENVIIGKLIPAGTGFNKDKALPEPGEAYTPGLDSEFAIVAPTSDDSVVGSTEE